MLRSLAYLLSILLICEGAKPVSPNIVFILMDDIGWNDVGFNDAQWPTPNIDWLQSHGVSLTRHYIHLMCSPSRSQFITGRYAMYSGYGQMLPWDYTEIGGIPIGQPTIASWLKEMGGYTTYGVGKWHLGYSSDALLPTKRGFDHFYGFYQGAIHYDNLKYIDIKYGDSNHFDFWEDGQPMTSLATAIAQRQDAILQYENGLDLRIATPNDDSPYARGSVYDDNTMYLYRDKIIEYIDSHNEATPFYMYVALQTIHGPLNEVPDKVSECKQILPLDATQRRHKYCQNMLLTDDVIGDITRKLREEESLWQNTLIVFTSDNGGDVANKGCNYPLRGTKGTLFDGNLRTIALISGGVIADTQHGTARDALFSSLDWTPTLLKYANLLSEIDANEMRWDGENQYDVIMTGDDTAKRDHIVMNIGTRNLESASIVFEYEDSLYKYIAKRDDIDRWAYIRDDGWCVPDENGNFALLLDDDISMAQAVNNRFLFELSSDVAEKMNLLQLDDAKYFEMVDYAKEILTPYTQHYLYIEPLKFLYGIYCLLHPFYMRKNMKSTCKRDSNRLIICTCHRQGRKAFKSMILHPTQEHCKPRSLCHGLHLLKSTHKRIPINRMCCNGCLCFC
eukprot:639660_1